MLLPPLSVAATWAAANDSLPAQEPAAKAAATFPTSQQRGIDFLLSQVKEGSIWGTQRGNAFPSIGLTALALAAVATKPADLMTDAEKEFVATTRATILAGQTKDGSFGESLATYQTSAAIHALVKFDRDDTRAAVQRARAFLVGAQNTEQHGYAPSDPNYGSFGYGPKTRGDMSNTQFAIEALREAGLETQNEAFTKAVAFLQRSQNLRSVNDFKGETTDRETKQTFKVEPADDGGGVYYPGNSAAGYDTLAEGVRSPRSYGSMTYALLKTYLLCGVEASDPRVQAAVKWISGNWTVETNPGASPSADPSARYQGLFYYYETMSRALSVAGMDTVAAAGEDKEGAKRHDWRKELRAHLEKTQRKDGSWLNEHNSRWWEDQPALCTVFALLALDQCKEAPAAPAEAGAKTKRR